MKNQANINGVNSGKPSADNGLPLPEARLPDNDF
jgi:hypothetical protein